MKLRPPLRVRPRTDAAACRVRGTCRRPGALTAHLVLLLLLAHAPAAFAEVPLDPETGAVASRSDSEAIVARAIAWQPGIAALHARAEALRREAEATRVDRPDPMVMGSVWVDTIGTMEPGRLRTMFEVSQSLPGRARRDAAAQPNAVRAERAAAEEALLEIAIGREVRLALLARARAEALHSALRQQDAVLADLEALLAETMAVGLGRYNDLLEIGLLREDVATRLESLKGDQESAVGRLAALLGTDAPVDLPGPDTRPVDPLFELHALPSVETLLAASLSHPLFRLADVERRASEAEHEALRVSRRPVPTVTFGVGSMPMMNEGTGMMVMAGVGMPIPVHGAATALRQEASALRAAGAADDASGAHTGLAAEIRANTVRHGEALARLARSEGSLLPLSDDVVERLLSDIETGRATYADVLQAVSRREALVARIVDARFDALVAQVELRALVGSALREVQP